MEGGGRGGGRSSRSSARVLADGEEADGDEAPQAARAVHGEGVEGVVDAEAAHQARRGVVDDGREHADDDGRPGINNHAARRDADEAATHSAHEQGRSGETRG